MTTNFQQPGFLSSSNIYCVNLRQYSEQGTFAAFLFHLPRLKDMGVDILWLMPIHPIGLLNRKGTLGSYYSIKDFEDVNPEYGSKADFKNLVDAAHALGMKVILDWVANHAAWDNVWTKTHPDFFIPDGHENFKTAFDWEDVIQINHSNPLQQQAMIDAMKYWITNFNIDGFRADLAHLTPLPFWINARTQLTPVKKDLIWLAETEDIPYHQAFDITFTWQWMHDTEDFYKEKKDFNSLLQTLQYYATAFPPPAMRMYFTSNHDENSWNGTEYEKYGTLVKALAVFGCTWPGIPLIYSGQELPVKKRLQFFDKDTIDWTADIELHDFYKTLLHLRKTNKALAAGTKNQPVLIEGAAQKELLAFYRKYDDDILFVFLNMGKQRVQFPFNAKEMKGNYKNIFTGKQVYFNDEEMLYLECGGFVVLEKLN